MSELSLPRFLSVTKLQELEYLIRALDDVEKLRTAFSNRYSMFLATLCPNKHLIKVVKLDEDAVYRVLKDYGLSKIDDIATLDKTKVLNLIKDIYEKAQKSKTRRRRKITVEDLEKAICRICNAKVNFVIIEPPKRLREFIDLLEKEKRALLSAIQSIINDHPLYKYYLQYVNGVGPATAGFIIWLLESRWFPYVTKLFAYVGLSVWGVCENCGYLTKKFKEGMLCPKCGKPLRGRLPTKKLASRFNVSLNFKPEYQRRCWIIGHTFAYMGSKSLYGRIYKIFKAEDEKTGKKTAWVRVTKLFLSHCWEVWLRILGLEPPKYYVFEKEQVHEYIPPLIDVSSVDELKQTLFYEKILKQMDIKPEQYINIIKRILLHSETIKSK